MPWLYRMHYGFRLLLTSGYQHTPAFTGAFDKAVTFLFYLSNLVVSEVSIRSSKKKTPAVENLLSIFLVVLFTTFSN